MRLDLTRLVRPAIGAAAVALVLATGLASANQEPEVHMHNNAYQPEALTISAGTAVRFVNDDGDIHTASQVGGGFESGLLFSKDSWTYTFNDPGTYQFVCLPHPYMHGTIVVQ
ncbi:MAG TPA: cupredoxin domain-containing protein [Chloroflexota bacterium]|jgi:plastocyanin